VKSRRKESNHGQGGQQEELAAKQEQDSPRDDLKLQSRYLKGYWQCGKEGHIAVGCPEQTVRAAKQLLHVTSSRGQHPQQHLAKQQNKVMTSKASHQSILG